tara:strand:+ start:45 stop:614 length:570 start_codon:yes stop_codon:yes gene_type:complete
MAIEKLKTKFALGSFINNVKTFYEKINEIIKYLNDDDSGTNRIIVEINSTNFMNLKNGNDGYGIMAIPQVDGKIIEIVNLPLIYRNEYSFTEGDFSLDTIEIYQGQGAQDFKINTTDIFTSTEVANKVFPGFDDKTGKLTQPKFYIGGTQLDPNESSVFIYGQFTGTPEINLLAKAWVVFDYIVRDTPK